MSWKIFVGAGVGVLAVAAAPFTGGGSIVAAVTLAESLAGAGAIAAGAGALGGGAGYLASKNDETKINNVKEEGRQEGKAESAIKISKLNKELNTLKGRMSNANDYFKTLVAMESIAVATIAYNGMDARSKQEEISDLLRSLSNDTLPQNIKNEINKIYLKPPTISEALVLAKNANLNLETCQNIILLTSESCNTNNYKFLTEWKKLA